MDVKGKAKRFAIKAHKGQYRKAELEKPYIFHPIDVALKLEKFGFDDNVIAAGYLHDVIEDTDYTSIDLEKEFGSDICSLVVGASEEDKSLSWEERKLGTIKRVRDLDLRHKAIVVCDKLSNTEDLIYKFGKDGYEDFSSFNRGKDKKIWYWEEVYKSLIYGEDKNHPMFVEFKNNIDSINNINSIISYNDNLDIGMFDDNISDLDMIRSLYYKKLELLKIKSIVNKYNYIIKFIGEDNKFRISIINKIKKYFENSGFNVDLVNSNNYKSNNYDILFVDDIELSEELFNDIDLIININNIDVIDMCNIIIDSMRNTYLNNYNNKKIVKKISKLK